MMKLLLLMGYFLFVALACASQESSAQKTFVVPGTLALDSSAVVQREELISFARAYLGRPYRYAGSDPKKGFDCSGFVHFVFNHFNIDSPRDSRSFDRLAAGKKPEDFKVGDVVVFKSFRDSKRVGHVGIVCEANGLKSKFIHSASGGRRGIMISDLAAARYARKFWKCIDLIYLKTGKP